jgi:hypothetical protein
MNKYPVMKYRAIGLSVMLLGLQVTGVQAAGEEMSPASGVVKQPMVFYKPPLRGAPQARVGGGTRGSGSIAVLQVLAPDHVGLTTRAQPTLYWYARTPAAARFEVALIDAEGIDPLLEVEAGAGKAAGIQQLNLGDHGVSLQPGVSYQWSVALVADAGSRATDLVASGVIERIEPDEGLDNRLSAGTGLQRVEIFASEGIWYDALDEISSLIAASPEDESLREVRDQLLLQVGLQEVVAE